MRTTQVAVVGAGPAGLSAAIAAARAGARTILLDEHPTPGGQLRYRIAELRRPDGGDGTVRPAALGSDLIAQAGAAGVDLRPASLAWGLFEDNVLAVVGGGASYQLQAERIVLATGSTDLPFPFAGGSLPGVFTARAVQILINLHRVLPVRRWAVLGGGAEAAEVAADLRLVGAEVVVTFDPAGDAAAVHALGVDGVRALVVAGQRHDVEGIALALGRQPDTELALMAECAAGYAPALGGFVPTRDDDLRLSDPRLLAAGDAAGLCDVPTALAEGRLAGISAAAALGLVDAGALAAAHRGYAETAAGRIAAAGGLRPAYVQG